MKKKTGKRLRILLVALVSLIVILAGGFYVYTLDYYRADAKAQEVFIASGESVPGKGGMTVFRPKDGTPRTAGLVFYPGGKVEAKAYAPLLQSLASKGIASVLIKMPFNLAVFGISAADRVYAAFPEITDWFLAGHSLGGAMASQYANNNEDRLSGLILLGAYPLNDAATPTLALYGTFDKGVDQEKLQGVSSLEIKGGNHAYFGDYGEQKGDGTATITREEQQRQAVEAMTAFIEETIGKD